MVSTPTSTHSTELCSASQAVTTYTVLMISDLGMSGYKYVSFENVEHVDINTIVHGELVRSGVWSGVDSGTCEA